MFDNEITQLTKELIYSHNQLKKANETIKELNILKNKSEKERILSSIEDLKLTHKLCEEDKKKYKEEIEKLIKKYYEGEAKIKELKEQNEKLRKIQENKKNNESNKKNLHIKNTIQLSNFLGFKSKKSKEIEEKHGNNNIQKKANSDDNKLYIQKISELEKKFKELKDKSNRFNETLEEQENIVNDYKTYLNDVNQNMNNFIERINISLINSIRIEENDKQKKIDEIFEQLEKVSLTLVNLDDSLLTIKNNFLKKIENILDSIYSELDELKKKENQNEYNFNSISQIINSEFNEIQKIFEQFWKKNENFYEKNHDAEEEMNKLKYLYKKYQEHYKEEMEKSRIIALKQEQDFALNDKESMNQNIFDSSSQNIPQNKNDIDLGQSFLFKAKNFQQKQDLYKTLNIFKETEEDILLEQYIEESQLLRKNYHVICYIYDDFDIYDIYYDLKAVGLRRGQYFPKCSHGFRYGRDIEIQSFSINGQQYPYIQRNTSIEFQIDLYNNESLKIHMLYKSSKNPSFLTQSELEESQIYKREYYGLDKSLAGQKAKFSLILKGNYDIVNFSEYFLIRNQNNTKEIEYMWGGIVPYEGRTTLVMLSKKEATWGFHFSVGLQSKSYIRNTMFYVPIEFIGGNNEILSINASCKESTNCILNEEEREYAIEFFHTQYNKANFSIEGVLKNKCKGEWEIDLTDEQIENLMPEEDRLCKEQLKYIAKKIISDFDKENKNSDFEFHDYMKIGLWVEKNIKYDLNYAGETQYSAIDIYNMKKGVCHHFTKLSNALLYSLGYKVLYASGYAVKGNNSFKTSTGHAWSLIKLSNNKWYPFDSTWGILTGKLPVGHIFSSFNGKHIKANGTDRINIVKGEMEGTFVE